jgi:RNA polymerase sigma-70 factor (ECF subfamily)
MTVADLRCVPVGDDEATLVDRLRAGDDDAFAALVRRHHASLHRVAVSIVGSSAVADEVVQETWLAVVRGVERFEGRSSFKTWLFHILVNRARSIATRERRTSPVDTDVLGERFDGSGAWATPPEPWSDRVDERLTAERLAPRARTLIEALPDSQRQVVVLRDVEGLAADEVAALLNITAGNQRVLLHRARAAVRAGLEAEVGRG